MKTSLRKLRGFAFHGHAEPKEQREQRDLRSSAKLDELAQASQDMEDMRDCYDSLLSAAAATANSAYEFSESLREMGACLLEKTALNDDEESGKVLLMLGKVQFELDKLIDAYRSHIFQTITIPSESLLNELRTVEEMKRLCDEKRDIYEYMNKKSRERGRSKSGKGESFSMQQIQVARDEYDEEATMFVFRLKSLKQGQSRSLLTQAARHHAAQSCFFKKALKSLEAVEPYVKSITERQHIDYQFSGLDDDDGDDYYDDDDDNSYDAHDDGELSFDYGQNDQDEDTASTSQNSMELDLADVMLPQAVKVVAAKENMDERRRSSFSFNREIRTGSQSAPLFAEKKLDAAGKIREMRPSLSRKLYSYALPTPVDTKRSISTGSVKPVLHTRQAMLTAPAQNMSHSTPLDSKKYERIFRDGKFSGPISRNPQSVLKESNINSDFSGLPPPLAEGLLYSQLDPFTASYSKKFKRQAFSGPLSKKPWSNKTVSNEHPRLFSGPILRNPTPQPSSSPKVSSSASPTFISLPKISELHELPRPPISSTSKSLRSLGLVGYSAPLVSRGQEHPAQHVSTAPDAALLLPTPAQTVPLSFSIPPSGTRATVIHVSNPAEAPHSSEIAEDVASAPPLSFLSTQL